MKILEIKSSNGENEIKFKELTIKAEWQFWNDYGVLSLKVFKNNKVIGGAHLESKGKNAPFVADDLYVNKEFQRRGIATKMYDYITKLGFKVEKSSDLSPDGEAFWKKYNKK